VPFAILMAGLAVASPYLPFTQILLMANKPGWYTVFIVLIVGINFVANLAFIPRYGVSGAALATSVAAFATAIGVRRFARSRVGVRI
jgi:O-antigen/teichoic acid export membrane protein